MTLVSGEDDRGCRVSLESTRVWGGEKQQTAEDIWGWSPRTREELQRLGEGLQQDPHVSTGGGRQILGLWWSGEDAAKHSRWRRKG